MRPDNKGKLGTYILAQGVIRSRYSELTQRKPRDEVLGTVQVLTRASY